MEKKSIKKEEIKSKINRLNSNIKSLEKELNEKRNMIIRIKLEIEKKNNENNLLMLKEQYNFINQRYQKKIKSLRIKLIKNEKKYINIAKFNENLNNEDLIFQNDKIKLLNELIKYRSLLSNISVSNEDNNEEYSKILKDYTSEDKTINESSFCEYTKLDTIYNRESLLDEKINEDIESKKIHNKIEIFKSKFLENKNKINFNT